MGDSSIQKNLNTALGVVANGVGVIGLSSNANQDRNINENSNNIETNKNINQKNKDTVNKNIDDINNTQIPEILDGISKEIEKKKKNLNSHIQKTVEDDFKDLKNNIQLRERQIKESSAESKKLENELENNINGLETKINELDNDFKRNLDLESNLMEKENDLKKHISDETERARKNEGEIMSGYGHSVYNKTIGNTVEIFEKNTDKTEKKSGWLWKKNGSELYVVSTCNDYIIMGEKTRLETLLQAKDKFYMVAFNSKIHSYQQFKIKLVSCCFRNNIGLFKFEDDYDMKKLVDSGFSLENQISLEKGDNCFMLGSYFDNLDNFSISKGVVRNNVYNQTGNESILVDIISDIDASSGSPIVDINGDIIAMKQGNAIEYSNSGLRSIVNSGNEWTFDYSLTNTGLFTDWDNSYFISNVSSLGFPTSLDGGNYLKLFVGWWELDPGENFLVKFDNWNDLVAGSTIEGLDLNGFLPINAWIGGSSEEYYQVLVDITGFLGSFTIENLIAFDSAWNLSSSNGTNYYLQTQPGFSNNYMSKPGTIGITKRIMKPVLEDLSNMIKPEYDDNNIIYDNHLRKTLILNEQFYYIPAHLHDKKWNWESWGLGESGDYYGGKKEITFNANGKNYSFKNFGNIIFGSSETDQYIIKLMGSHPEYSFGVGPRAIGMVYKPMIGDPNYEERDQQDDIFIKFGNFNDDQKTISSVTQFIEESNYDDAKLVFLVYKTLIGEPPEDDNKDNMDVHVVSLQDLFGEWSDDKLSDFTTKYFLDDIEVPHFRKKNKKNYIKLLKENKKIKKNKKMQQHQKRLKMLKLREKNKV